MTRCGTSCAMSSGQRALVGAGCSQLACHGARPSHHSSASALRQTDVGAGLQRHGFSTTTCRPFLNVPHSRASSRRRCMQVTAQFTRRSRLATQITTVPRRLDAYFAGSILRQALWTCIAFFAGFYAANTVSLSFGALSINDVVAAAVTVAYVEVTSYIYYQADVVTLKLQFANSFKLGVVAALLADAMKLQG